MLECTNKQRFRILGGKNQVNDFTQLILNKYSNVKLKVKYLRIVSSLTYLQLPRNHQLTKNPKINLYY